MSTPNSLIRRGPLGRSTLWLIAGGIVIAGLAATWWFSEHRKAPEPHPETQLFRRIDEPRVSLAEVFRSGDSEAAVATTLEAAGLSVQRRVVERPTDPRYPPRRMATFTINGYKHLDCEGALVLEFFNNRLMEADFRPEDAARYAPRLHRSYPMLALDRTGHAEAVDGPLRIWASVDLAKSKVGRSLGSEGLVLWQDLRLTRQRDDWDARYGTIPVPYQKP